MGMIALLFVIIGRLIVYDKLPLELLTSTGNRQGSPLSLFR